MNNIQDIKSDIIKNISEEAEVKAKQSRQRMGLSQKQAEIIPAELGNMHLRFQQMISDATVDMTAFLKVVAKTMKTNRTVLGLVVKNFKSESKEEPKEKLDKK